MSELQALEPHCKCILLAKAVLLGTVDRWEQQRARQLAAAAAVAKEGGEEEEGEEKGEKAAWGGVGGVGEQRAVEAGWSASAETVQEISALTERLVALDPMRKM